MECVSNFSKGHLARHLKTKYGLCEYVSSAQQIQFLNGGGTNNEQMINKGRTLKMKEEPWD